MDLRFNCDIDGPPQSNLPENPSGFQWKLQSAQKQINDNELHTLTVKVEQDGAKLRNLRISDGKNNCRFVTVGEWQNYRVSGNPSESDYATACSKRCGSGERELKQ